MTVSPGANRSPVQPQRNRAIGGIMLILIGLLALIAQLVPGEWLGLWIVPILGGLFVLWGLLAGELGFLIPGGVLLGVGAGIVLRSYLAPLDDRTTGAVFLFSMAAGWALISVFALLLHKVVWWTLIVGACLALVGVAMMLGGPAITILELLGRLWPLALIAIGAYWLYRLYLKR